MATWGHNLFSQNLIEKISSLVPIGTQGDRTGPSHGRFHPVLGGVCALEVCRDHTWERSCRSKGRKCFVKKKTEKKKRGWNENISL